jgi:hypothetical protein
MTETDRSPWTPLDLGVRFDARPYRLLVGVRRLDLDAWLLVDDERASQLRQKQELLATHPSTVVRSLPESDDACAELLDLVLEAVVTAGLVEVVGHRAMDRATGTATDLTALHPIDAAGRLVQEDVCVMQRDVDGLWRLTAGSVCFPSRWSLTQKLGRTMAGIHAPVPGYDRIARATDAAMDRVLVGGPMTRANWTLIDDRALFQPATEDEHGRDRTVTSATRDIREKASEGDSLVLRIERQTLRPLPRTGAIAFTIRTVVSSLADLSPEESAALATTLRTVELATMEYKGWAERLPGVIDRLDRRHHG